MSLMKAVLAQSSITIKEPQAGVKDIGKLLSSGIQVAMIIAAILTFAFLVWGGIQWILSGGDKTQTQAARDRITMALVGLGIVAAAWALMKVIGLFFFLGLTVFFNSPIQAQPIICTAGSTVTCPNRATDKCVCGQVGALSGCICTDS